MNNELNLMQARLHLRGGEAQQDRMIQDKRKTLDKVVLYSYQGATVRSLGSKVKARALINPNKVKQDYDDKIISIGYEYKYTPGTVFEWLNTGTKWLIYLQDLTELAYFKGDIRRCNYEISWKNADGNIITTAAAIRGPVETKIDSIQKEGVSLDTPNHSLDILIPKNKDTVEYFTRYSKFYLKTLGAEPVCWRVEATDSISMPGILQVVAIEYYANETEDNLATGIVGGLIAKEIPKPQDTEIIGETFIKPKVSYSYTYLGENVNEWSFDTRLPIEIIKKDEKQIIIKWTKTYTGQFVLHYGSKEKTIVVESLF